MPAPQDTKVLSPVTGTVVNTYFSNTVGNTVEIEKNNYKFVFHHLNYISAKKGKEIKQGDVLGGVGTTGTYSTR